MPVSALPPGFMVVHGNRTELLRSLLVQWLQVHPLPPLSDEIILVQSNGIAQWLKMSLAMNPAPDNTGGLGIAAALDMQLPSRFTWQAYRAVLGPQAVPEHSPFDKPLLIWRLMRLLPALVHQPGYEPLHRFLDNDTDLRKRYQLAEKIADLFDQYQVYRADWLDAWSHGRAELPRADGGTTVLDDANRWQALLWQTLLDDVGPERDTSRAAVHQRFLQEAATLEQRPDGLPERVSVFGLSSLPRQSLEVLLTLARFSQVLLCVQNPCEHYWADILTAREHARKMSKRHARKPGTPQELTEDTLHLHAHPLLAAWGRQGRDYIALLDELDDPENYRRRFEALGQRIDLFESTGNATLLQQLQDDIRQLRSVSDLVASPWPAVDPRSDHSIRLHSAHSLQREVEILHDQLLDALNADPTLNPRDILVMVPDVNQYAPHIQAVFGLIDGSDARHIPFSIADQQQRHQAPMVFALDTLLNSPDARLGVTEVLDLLDVAAVRARFGIAEDDLTTLRHWIEQANIRWGLDTEHRRRFVPLGNEQNTWVHGLKRMLLGYATGDDPTGRTDTHWNAIEPLGEVSGLEAALAGCLARLIDQLLHTAHALTHDATPADWEERLRTLLTDFMAPTTLQDNLLLTRLQESLLAWREACDKASLTEALPLSVVRDHWLSQVDQATLAQRFQAGRLTFATLMPMRAIPFRMICLLGMNDGDFPRSRPPVDFDLMARELRPGDRSRREDDRYLFLEALLSARERLYISWVGRSITDNAEQPASVLVNQLKDHLDACWTLAPGSEAASVSAALTLEHRLQPFNPDYFSSASTDLFTYAKEWERGNDTAATQAQATTELPFYLPEGAIDLSLLARFLKDPVSFFFAERLKIHYADIDSGGHDHEPFALAPLKKWSLQDELIQARLDAFRNGQSQQGAETRVLERFARRGDLPLGGGALLAQDALRAPLDQMFGNYEKACLGRVPLEPVRFDHAVTLDGHTLHVTGRLRDLFQDTDSGEFVRIELNPRTLIKNGQYRRDRLLHAWVQHLACHLTFEPMKSILVGKDEGRVELQPLEPGQAHEYFRTLVQTLMQGLQEPLPLDTLTGFEWLRVLRKTNNDPDALPPTDAALAAARSAYEGTMNSQGQVQLKPALRRQYPTLDDLTRSGRFAQLCDALLAPVFDCVGAATKGNSQ